MMLQPMLVKNCIKWNCLFLDCVVLRKLQPLCCQIDILFMQITV
jgi:hypothetical protein